MPFPPEPEEIIPAKVRNSVAGSQFCGRRYSKWAPAQTAGKIWGGLGAPILKVLPTKLSKAFPVMKTTGLISPGYREAAKTTKRAVATSCWPPATVIDVPCTDGPSFPSFPGIGVDDRISSFIRILVCDSRGA